MPSDNDTYSIHGQLLSHPTKAPDDERLEIARKQQGVASRFAKILKEEGMFLPEVTSWILSEWVDMKPSQVGRSWWTRQADTSPYEGLFVEVIGYDSPGYGWANGNPKRWPTVEEAKAAYDDHLRSLGYILLDPPQPPASAESKDELTLAREELGALRDEMIGINAQITDLQELSLKLKARLWDIVPTGSKYGLLDQATRKVAELERRAADGDLLQVRARFKHPIGVRGGPWVSHVLAKNGPKQASIREPGSSVLTVIPSSYMEIHPEDAHLVKCLGKEEVSG